jgi:hypothetical protein
MASRNVYPQYKRDTSCLLYWLIQSSNTINVIRSSKELEEGEPTEVDTTGKITVVKLVALAKFIGKHITTVPPIILHLFRSVINARTDTYDWFRELVAATPDPAVERSNKSHKYFIDALTEAFHALGGKEWEDAGRPGVKIAKDASGAKAQLDELILENLTPWVLRPPTSRRTMTTTTSLMRPPDGTQLLRGANVNNPDKEEERGGNGRRRQTSNGIN